MEFEGRIQRVLPVRSGTSQRGEWKALPFVFEYFESQDQRWSDKVLLETFDANIMAQIGTYLKKGPDGKAVVENGECVLVAELKVRIGFSHNVRTGQRQDGTAFHMNDIRLYRFEVENGRQHGAGVAVVQPQTGQPNTSQYGQRTAVAPFPPQVDANGNPQNDDLPF